MRQGWTAAATALVLLAGCSPPPTKSVSGGPVAVCELADKHITEASGLAASRRHAGLYYVHNDSADVAQVFLVDRTGQTRLTIHLANVGVLDCEDIAMAPGAKPGTWDVCLADIGDNHDNRKSVAIHRFPEPDLPEGGPPSIAVPVATTRLRYADGPANAEAFCVHPRTGDACIFTKSTTGRSRVYQLRAPWPTEGVTELPRVADVVLPPAVSLGRVITGADIAPDGRRVAVRCYVDGWQWRVPADLPDTDFVQVFARAPELLALPVEPQGEAVCFSADGKFLATISEGRYQTLYETPAD